MMQDEKQRRESFEYSANKRLEELQKQEQSINLQAKQHAQDYLKSKG